MGDRKVIDAHHHLWRYTREEYGWIDESMQRIRRDFLPADLTEEMARAGVDGAVAVQARQSLEETRWLLELADGCAAMRGVVGWVPIADPKFMKVMEEFAGRVKLKGLRHVIQGEPDENYILREDFNQGIRSLTGTGLVYDILIFERHLPQTAHFIDRHPNQMFVLDHIAKPKIAAGEREPWTAQIRELAKRENVSCKISGLVTEAKWDTWSLQTLRPYLDVVVEAFGPVRLMAGSDWPVCLVASEYEQWWNTLRTYFAAFSESEKESIFGATATNVYRL